MKKLTIILSICITTSIIESAFAGARMNGIAATSTEIQQLLQLSTSGLAVQK